MPQAQLKTVLYSNSILHLQNFRATTGIQHDDMKNEELEFKEIIVGLIHAEEKV